MASNKYYPEDVLVEKIQSGEYGWLEYVNHHSAEWQEEYESYCLNNGLCICEESAEHTRRNNSKKDKRRVFMAINKKGTDYPDTHGSSDEAAKSV